VFAALGHLVDVFPHHTDGVVYLLLEARCQHVCSRGFRARFRRREPRRSLHGVQGKMIQVAITNDRCTVLEGRTSGVAPGLKRESRRTA
jgi:hypothetical protein